MKNCPKRILVAMSIICLGFQAASSGLSAAEPQQTVALQTEVQEVARVKRAQFLNDHLHLDELRDRLVKKLALDNAQSTDLDRILSTLVEALANGAKVDKSVTELRDSLESRFGESTAVVIGELLAGGSKGDSVAPKTSAVFVELTSFEEDDEETEDEDEDEEDEDENEDEDEDEDGVQASEGHELSIEFEVKKEQAEAVAEAVEAWAERFAEHMEEHSERFESHLEELGDKMESWSEQFSEGWEDWAEEHEDEWEGWAEQYEQKWQVWSQKLKNSDAKEEIHDVIRGNLEQLSQMPLLELYEQLVRSAKQVEDIPWDNFEGVEGFVRQSIEESLSAMEEMSHESVPSAFGDQQETLENLLRSLEKLRSGMERKGRELELKANSQLKKAKEALEGGNFEDVAKLKKQLKKLREIQAKEAADLARQANERVLLKRADSVALKAQARALEMDSKAKRQELIQMQKKMRDQGLKLAQEAKNEAESQYEELRQMHQRLKLEQEKVNRERKFLEENPSSEDLSSYAARLIKRIKSIEKSGGDRRAMAEALYKDIAGEQDLIKAQNDAIQELRQELRRLRQEVDRMGKRAG